MKKKVTRKVMSDEAKPDLPEKYSDRTVLLKKEVAEMYHTSVRTIERRIEEGRIPVVPEMLPQVRIPANHFKKK